MKQVSLFKSGLILSGAKILRIVISFYTFGVVPRYLDKFEYGLIAVIGSSTVLLSTLDFGFGQGLRNKLNNENNNVKQANYFFSVFLTLLISLTIIGFLFFGVLQITDASKVLFAIPSSRTDLIFASNVCLGLFLINIPFSMSTLLMMSFHEYKTIFLFEMINVVFNVILASLLLILKSNFSGGLFLELTILGTLTINAIFTIVFIARRKWFNIKYIQPWKLWIKDLKEVFRIGRQFLLGAISYTIFFYADSIIIAQLFNLEKAGDFRILLTIFQSLIAVMQSYYSPLWDISGKLYATNDIKSIKRTLNRNFYFLILLFVIGLICAPLFLLPILNLWTGRIIEMNFIGIIILQIWFIFNLLPYSYNMVLNGMGKIRPIIVVQVIGAILKIPICIWLGRNYGTSGIIAANSIILLGPVIIYPLYTYKYLSKVNLPC